MSNPTNGESPQSVMRNRAFRCEDDLWVEAQRLAAANGDNISELLRETLRRYVTKQSKSKQQR